MRSTKGKAVSKRVQSAVRHWVSCPSDLIKSENHCCSSIAQLLQWARAIHGYFVSMKHEKQSAAWRQVVVMVQGVNSRSMFAFIGVCWLIPKKGLDLQVQARLKPSSLSGGASTVHRHRFSILYYMSNGIRLIEACSYHSLRATDNHLECSPSFDAK